MLVTVIIPCYNVENYIVECINAVLNQTYKNIQIVCVNNNSTDTTLTLLTRFASDHSSIITLVEEKQKGAPFARNRGLLEAKGEYIQFLDADDLLEPSKIEHQIDLLKNNNKPEIIVADYYRQAIDGSKKMNKVNATDFWLALLSTQLGITSANLFKTTMVKHVKGFNTALKSSQEYELMFKMMQVGARVLHDNKALTTIRDRETGAISQQNLAENTERYVQLRSAIVAHLQTITPNEKMQAYYQALFDAIRIFYKHNKAGAIQAQKTMLPQSFKPTVSAATTNGYAMMYRLLGFEKTEFVKQIMGK